MVWIFSVLQVACLKKSKKNSSTYDIYFDFVCVQTRGFSIQGFVYNIFYTLKFSIYYYMLYKKARYKKVCHLHRWLWSSSSFSSFSSPSIPTTWDRPPLFYTTTFPFFCAPPQLSTLGRRVTVISIEITCFFLLTCYIIKTLWNKKQKLKENLFFLLFKFTYHMLCKIFTIHIYNILFYMT